MGTRMGANIKRLFGTDGIRGMADVFPLDAQTMRAVGASLARRMGEKLGRQPRLLTGRDTRESGPRIERELTTGVTESVGFCRSAGVMTTPGIAYLTRHFGFDAGVVISASHNPFDDNGIKIFAPSGKKIGESAELAIEGDIFSSQHTSFLSADTEVIEQPGADFAYLEHLAAHSDGLDLHGMKIVLDCSNGAASSLAPELFKRLGANVNAIHATPDGRNINRDCGSLHMSDLQQKVISEKADIGIAFDGDADRALFVDEKGTLVDGDGALWALCRWMTGRGELANKTVVATVMSNIGLELALKSAGLDLLRAPVGDRFVLEELLKTGSEIGGEQSGHIIFPAISLVGDGIMSAICVLEAVQATGGSLSKAVEGFVRYPQILVNVKVREKQPFESVSKIADAAQRVERQLNGSGRLLLRYSGTENLARVMIEGQDQAAIESQANELAGVIRAELG
ncbi:MAG: phosphoglucosamine mutase [Acidobacteriota bacterium]